MELSNKKKWRILSVFKYIILSILVIGVIGSVAFAGVVLSMIKSAPELNLENILTLSEVSSLYDDKGEYIDDVPAIQKREIVTNDAISNYIKDGIVCIEDERFYNHHGVDIKRIFGALFQDIKNKITNVEGLHGASTITQQLIKNTMLTNEVKLKRKVQEIYLATELEKQLSKDKILEAYLNTINFGGEIYGVEKASESYFGKKASEVELIQAAYICGVIQNPAEFSYFMDYAKENPDRYFNRTKNVLAKMLEFNKISQEDYDNAISQIDTNGVDAFHFDESNKEEVVHRMNYEWFCRPVINQVKEDLKAKFSLNDNEVVDELVNGGLKIYTTMDRSMQDNAQAVMDSDELLGLTSAPLPDDPDQIIQPQGGAVIMDYKSGEVKVIIGGRGNQPANAFNRGASNDYKIPTGSSIKPITVYAPAIELKKITPSTIVDDSPLSAALQRKYESNGEAYTPENYDQTFKGPMTVKTALALSRNLPALKIEDSIGVETGVQYAAKFGITFPEQYQTLASVALGEFEGSNPLEMAAAFGVFGNNGTYTNPRLYTRVEDKNGEIILETSTETHEVISSETAYIMYDLLKTAASSQGTGGKAIFRSDVSIAGKTGTSEKFKYHWFAGVTPYYTGAVWFGNDEPIEYSPSALDSGMSAAVWGRMMDYTHQNLPGKDIDKPTGSKLSTVLICMDSGKLATENCANEVRGSRVHVETVNGSNTPTEHCDQHIAVEVNEANNKLATALTPSYLIVKKVFLNVPWDGQGERPNYLVPMEYDDMGQGDIQNQNSNPLNNSNSSSENNNSSNQIYVDQNGNYVDQNGNPVDQNGNPINQNNNNAPNPSN